MGSGVATSRTSSATGSRMARAELAERGVTRDPLSAFLLFSLFPPLPLQQCLRWSRPTWIGFKPDVPFVRQTRRAFSLMRSARECSQLLPARALSRCAYYSYSSEPAQAATEQAQAATEARAVLAHPATFVASPHGQRSGPELDACRSRSWRKSARPRVLD